MSVRALTRAALFHAWDEAGFPAPQPDRDRELLQVPPAPGAVPAGEAPPLHPDVVRRVHGFGFAVGWSMGRLLGLDHDAALERADWCGRFNLGISLYDYVCDETGRGDLLLGVEPFASLVGHDPLEASGLREEEAVLCDLAARLLTELAQLAGPAGRAEQAGGWDPRADLGRLQAAQHQVAAWSIGPEADLDAVEDVLRTKSVDPFVVMGRWVAAGLDARTTSATNSALGATLGDAVGRCVWVVDDAADLWRDLDTASWNLLLVRAARVEPAFLSTPRSTLTDIHLDRVIRSRGLAEAAAREAVAALQKAVERCPAEPGVRRDALARLGAGLAVW